LVVIEAIADIGDALEPEGSVVNDPKQTSQISAPAFALDLNRRRAPEMQQRLVGLIAEFLEGSSLTLD
jgi:hypothetical protein